MQQAQRAVGLCAATLSASKARAHSGGPPITPHDFWTAWSLQLPVVLPIAVAAALYARGLQLAWSRAGFGRGVPAWRAVLFALGLIALWTALIWPLDAMGESLFSAHMAQHIVLMGLAAPLLVLGLPLPTMMRALPRGWQRGLALCVHWKPWRRAWQALTRVEVATVLQLLVFAFWHIPAAIALSLEDEVVHSIMHGSIFGSGLLFWTAVLRMRSGEVGVSVFALFVNFKFSLIVGALLAFSPRAFYVSYADRGLPWGVALLEDQQLAGLLMMIVQPMMYLVAIVLLVAACFRAMEEATGRSSAAPLPGQVR